MKVNDMVARASARLEQGATPLYSYIMDTLHGHGVPPLEDGPGALTAGVVKTIQKAGWRGFLGISIFEPPKPKAKKNKFTLLAAEPFSGLYPRHLLTARGLEILYGERRPARPRRT